MARRRTVDLLPEIFRTDTNRKFLSATLDQLTQEPSTKRTQGYVGRRVGPGVNPADNYVAEPTAARQDYQLEPGVVFLKPDTNVAEDAITYPGIIDALDIQGGQTTQQDRLFQSQYYSWDPFCDLDKFTNYSQYYWLPQGPDSVDVSTTATPLTDAWDVTRTSIGYTFSDVAGENPTLTMVRGGNYEFNVNQIGANFWIQAAPGVNGRFPTSPNISSRDVLGVINNGAEQGTVTFNVPLKNAQDFYYTLADIGTVDLITTDFKFNELNNVFVDTFLAANPQGVDGITNLDGRTIVFTNTTTDAQDGGWQINTQFDPLVQSPSNNGVVGSFDTMLFDQTTDITSQAQRYSVWQIQYIYDTDGLPYMQLSSVLNVANLSKFRINFGTQYANTQWYKNASGYFQEIPLLTAVLDTLYYQDSVNPELFGRIRLIDPDTIAPVDLNEIIGAKNYTSPTGIVFTNGLKVQFRGPTIPAQYQDLEYYVEGVGTGLGIDARVGFINGEAYYGPFHVYNGQRRTGDRYDTTVFQLNIYPTVEESLLYLNAGGPDGAPLPTVGQFGASVGNGIRLLPVTDFVTPETYTKSSTIPYDSTTYDSTPYDASLNAPEVPDYLTINRASQDRNAWSRSNRWFHRDVIEATATYNNQIAVFDNDFRAKRPIVEFRADMDLFNFGTQGKQPVNIVDFRETDALSNINGQLGYGVDGYTFIDGTRVIFAADVDSEVRNRIYVVNFIDPDGNPNSAKIINLTPAVDGTAVIGQTVVSLSGQTQQGKSYWFDGIAWQEAQQKTSVNQAPLFDVYDIEGRSFSNSTAYPSTDFVGSKLFGYALGGTSTTDLVLGFALKYLNINNVGDIVFENFFYTDTFKYVQDNIGQTLNISTGFARQYIDRVNFSSLIGWLPAAAENRSRQVFRFSYDGTSLIFDVPAVTNSVFPALQIFIEGEFVDPTTYTTTITDTNTVVIFNTTIPTGTIIEAQIVSDSTSAVAFYQIPLNLENNPLNKNSNEFTLGTIRTHYESIGQNLKNIQGPIVGANNTRDLGNILPYGDNIIQNSSPLALTGAFLRRRQYELFNALVFNSQEYEKYKARLLDLVTKGDYINLTTTEVLDAVLQEIALNRSAQNPFYWSDMITAGETYTENTYTYTNISTPTFDLLTTYDFTSSNYQGLSVFLNGVLLTRGYEYTVSSDAPILTITVPLAVGDIIIIREYPTTYGSFVPNTPTKMGLYPAYRPEIFTDAGYVNPTPVIRGHDGSITVAFGDIRDEVLLEFEKRIYNNLKIVTPIPLTEDDVIPGQFRETDYTLVEINNILSQDFLSWVGWNKLDYITQTYLANNEFTYNYSQSSDRLTRQPLLGNWRGIYDYFYDTVSPNTRPWEMLGFSEIPSWWEDLYGPAPYTSGNLVLWEDLAAGVVRDPAGEYVLPQYARPGLLNVIPSGTEGELLSPIYSTVGNYDTTTFRRSWVFGDDGPVEYAWRSSSAYPFAVMRLLALTKPAQFFSLFADRDRYVFDDGLGQYLWDGRYRLDAKNINPIYGDGTSKASYIDWIVDYNRQLGTPSTADLTVLLSNLDVRLCWRTAAFTDKKFLKIYTERSTPQSQNTSLLLPDESYSLLLYHNQAFDRVAYSSVIIQSTEDGWAVLGYSATQPYFNILQSKVNGVNRTLSVAGTTVKISTEWTDNVVQVPYGYVFTSRTAVCDFLLSYGQFLQTQGMAFLTRQNGYIMDWFQMAQEFLYWSQQGWGVGAITNLNPCSTQMELTKPLSVAESLVPVNPENIILNQNRQAVPAGDLVIDRLENTFRVTSLTSNTINYVNLRFTAYEHIIILDNVSIFADLIYDPVTGARQSRVNVSGTLSADWNGTLDAPGFILNQDNIQAWRSNRKYAKGEIVLFKNEYWSASTIIQPSQKFDYNLWIRTEYDQIQKGLLPNAANDSDQLANAYNVYAANLEEEVDLFSYGLIGFRPREYMAALNLDDVSQVQLYQQFLGSKGTLRSAEIFTLANLGKETAQYDIYEYWAMLRGTYGANANRSYYELLLNEALLKSDPSLIQVINPGEESQADQTVLLQNVWKESTKLSSPNILPTTLTPTTDTALPTAGYVNFNDVDITIFSLDDTVSLNAQLDSIGVGTIIWVAKINPYNWGIYEVEGIDGTVTTVSNNLDGRSLVTFNKAHGLSTGEYLIIKGFDTAINGAYRVKSVPSIFTVIIEYTFSGTQQSLSGTGEAYTLASARVAQASDLAGGAEPDYDIVAGEKYWIDDIGDGRWAVLEKTDPFTLGTTLEPQQPVENSEFGSAVAQGFFNLSALVGAPGYNPNELATAPGAIYTYVRTDADAYAQNAILQLGATGTAGYGNALEIGNQIWAVVGASKSNNDQGYAGVVYRQPGSDAFEQRQVLIAPDQDFDPNEFGYAVAISQDEHWMYIGAPAANKVYAYTRVDVQTQSVSYITDGESNIYNWSNHIVIAPGEYQQFVVVLNNVILTYNVDYVVGTNTITLVTVPDAGKELTLIRREGLQLDQEVYKNVTQDSTTGSGTGAEFTINRVRGTYYVELTNAGENYGIGDTLTIDAATIGGGSSPANDLVITVTDVNALTGAITTWTQSGSGVGTTSVFPLDPYLATATNIFSFKVTVNGVLYRPFIDYEFNSDSALLAYDLVFNTLPPAGAEIIVTSKDYFDYVSTITVGGLEPTARFGHSITTTTDGSQVLVGCPVTQDVEGRVYVFNRGVEKQLVTNDATLTYTTVNTLESPTQVKLNGQFLINTDLNIGGTFTVDGSNQITLDTALTVGDVIEIDTNQFTLLQIVTSQEPFETAQFGYAVDICQNDCTLYVGAPYHGSVLPEAGRVEVNQNPARVFGVITSTIANPTLTSGEYININGYFVECTGTTVADLAADIVAANIPNATATVTSDLVFTADGTSKTYDVGTIYSAVSSYTPVVYVNDTLQTYSVDYTYNNSTKQITFTTAPSGTDVITVVSGRITFSVKNADAGTPANLLSVLPGTGTVFSDLGLSVFEWIQTVVSPVPQDYAHFGESLFISDDVSTLFVGAPNGTPLRPTTFDSNTTVFDSGSTEFFDPLAQAGVVYQYDFLPSANPSLSNPYQFVFGQQLFDANGQTLDKFGQAIDYSTGVLLIGNPGDNLGDSQANYGSVVQLDNADHDPAWRTIHIQQPVVDINLLNTVFMYDQATGAPKQYFDYFNPLQGRVLGVVRQNLDYIGAVDPAAYNVGDVNNYGERWAEEHVGQIWWDTTNARFIDPNQDDIVYASRRWGQLFPGSAVQVYQWVSSPVPPSQYAGPGTVFDSNRYAVSSSLNQQGIFSSVYYFWVTGIITVNTAAKKTLSVESITNYIESPKSSGISYIAPINASTTAIYNDLSYISAQDTILHIEYDQKLNDAAVHVEYQLIPQDRADGFLTDQLYRKMQDSFCGVDTAGNLVPDPFLSPSEKYGVDFRPRQSFFINRFLALQNYLQGANRVLAQSPITETRQFNLLNSYEPEPVAGTGAWDFRVATYEELTFQNIQAVSLGYKYLVASDSTNNGLWTIYQVVSGLLPGSRELALIRVQNYDTRLYWHKIDWYQVGFNPLTRVLLEVPNYSALATITVPNGSIVKVTANAQNKWELYRLNTTEWTRVGLQDGTIAFDETLWNYQLGRFGFDVEVFDAQYFDQEPVIETRKIIQAINQELLIDDLLIERNRLLILMFNYILSEQIAPQWLTKTSLIDVDHTIRELLPYQIYRQDNQDFVLQYINEVKPYHTQIRQFNLIYTGNDTYQGSLTDFDLPAYWDPTQDLFISPVLDDTGTLSKTSSVPSTSTVWQTFPWNQWYQNYLLEITGVEIIDAGSGYTVAPDLVVTGDCITPAVMHCRVNSAGDIVDVIIDDPGSGYSSTAIITITGGNGTGGQIVAVMGNGLVRNIITTIKYDRYEYTSNITDWTAGVIYTDGTQVRYDDRVWEANGTVTGTEFDPDNWTLVPAGDLSGINRTQGYYTPGANEPGLDLGVLISGINYPGVQVNAPDFNQNTGFDVGNYDINPYDNISYGPDGRPTYDPAILDAIYESEFTDPYLGTLPAPAYNGDPPTTGPNPIVVDGGAFVDTYSSHAPEELVPGAMFDTLDMRVFTTPGSDWQGNGHGFPIKAINYVYATGETYSFAGLLDNTIIVQVWNQTQGLQLYPGVDYTVDWVSYTVTITSGANVGDNIEILAYSLGGGNQLYSNTYVGSDVGNTVTIPFETAIIVNMVIFVNGAEVTDYTWVASGFNTVITFGTTYGATDRITLTAMGSQTDSTESDWSVPITQYIVSDGGLAYTLTNSMSGTNTVNAIVEISGRRARPNEGAEYIGDDTTVSFALPTRGGYSQGLIADNDVIVFVDNTQVVLGVAYTVDPWDGSSDRNITFVNPPANGAEILVTVRTAAQYWITGSTLTFRPMGGFVPILGDIISVTSFNDTKEQNILTQVFVGPSSQGLVISEGFDDTTFDEGNVTGDPGSFSYQVGTSIQTNRFPTGRAIPNTARIEVTLDGYALFENQGFVVDGEDVVLLGPAIGATQVVVITSYTQNVVPGAIAFRIFQDMRGLQSTYRITPQTTTTLVQALSATGDTIYVDDASALSEPNLPQGIFGLITIDGERIAYRERDTVANTLSGLRRGTAGTGADSHAVGANIYDIGQGNLLPVQYQNSYQYNNFLGDGSTSVFVCPDVSVSSLDSTEIVEAVLVYVGGILQTSGYTITGESPVVVTFDEPVTAGYQVSVRVEKGLSWYAPGSGTASNGIPLQEQDTMAARFIRGE